MASMWQTLGKLAVREGPRIFRQLQRSGAIDKVTDAIGSRTRSAGSATTAVTPGRTVSSTSAQTAHRARAVAYSPDLDGKADPGEIVWTWVAFEEDPNQGKDRPVLVVGRDGTTLLGLMLSSQARRDGDRDWLALGSGSWDPERRPSWVRLDRVLDVPESGIRREGSILPKDRFDLVANELRGQFDWS